MSETNIEKDYFLFEGRPRGMECTEMEYKVYDFLEAVDIDFHTLKHPQAFSMEECQKIRDRINAPVAKNLFLTNKQQSRFYLLVMPADKVFKTKYLSTQINSARLSFADESHMVDLLGVKPGSVTPLGLINDKDLRVTLLIDEDLKNQEMFACHPCINSASIVVSFEDFINKIIPHTRHQINWVSLPWEL